MPLYSSNPTPQVSEKFEEGKEPSKRQKKEGGEKGGSLLFEGNPEEFINKNQLHSYTQKYLKEYF